MQSNKAPGVKKPYFMRLSAQTKRPETDTKRPVLDKLTKRLKIMIPPEARGFESLRLRHKKHRSSVRITVFFCSISIVGGEKIRKIRVYDIYKWLIIFKPCIYR